MAIAREVAGPARYVSQYLSGIKRKELKEAIRVAFQRRSGGRTTRLTRRSQEWLHDAIFEVMDEMERRNGGQPDHPLASSYGRRDSTPLDRRDPHPFLLR